MKQLDAFKMKLNQTIEDAQNTKIGKQVFDELSSQSKNVKDTFSKQTEQLRKSQAIHTIRKGVRSIKEEVEDSTLPGSRLYRAPIVLRKRTDYKILQDDDRVIQPNE